MHVLKVHFKKVWTEKYKDPLPPTLFTHICSLITMSDNFHTLSIYSFPTRDSLVRSRASLGMGSHRGRITTTRLGRRRRTHVIEDTLFDTNMYHNRHLHAKARRFYISDSETSCDDPSVSGLEEDNNDWPQQPCLMDIIPDCIIERIVHDNIIKSAADPLDYLSTYREALRSLSPMCKSLHKTILSTKFKGVKEQVWQACMLPHVSVQAARRIRDQFPDLCNLTLKIRAADAEAVAVPKLHGIKSLTYEIDINECYKELRIALDVCTHTLEDLTIRFTSSGNDNTAASQYVVLTTNMSNNTFANLRKLTVVHEPDPKSAKMRSVGVDFYTQLVEALGARNAPLLDSVCLRNVGCSAYLISQLFNEPAELYEEGDESNDEEVSNEDLVPLKCGCIEIDWHCTMASNLEDKLRTMGHQFRELKINVKKCDPEPGVCTCRLALRQGLCAILEERQSNTNLVLVDA